jgi:hypothetical protein
MRKPDRALYDVARRVMTAQPAAAPLTSGEAAAAMQGSCGDLYRVLETAIGPAGLQALLGRAIQIASRDHPWLASVKPGTAADCPLSGLTEAADLLDVVNALEGYTALLATIIWLLVTFIGEDLTLRFVRHAWPKLSFSRLSEDSKE